MSRLTGGEDEQGVVYDVIVVGAGIEGSATAYHLAKQGQRTLLLEQFPLPHTRGSSHGQSRITRMAYPQQIYSEMMRDGFEGWKVLQEESGQTLYKNCGGLYLGPPSDLKSIEEGLKANNGPYSSLSLPDLNSQYPQFKLPKQYHGIYDHQGGILYADKALLAFQTQFQNYGGTLRDGEQVIDIIPGDVVMLKTASENVFRGKKVVLAIGPFTNNLLAKLNLQLPLTVVRLSVHYWKEKVKGTHSSSIFPCFIDLIGPDGSSYVYSIPSDEYPGLVKVCDGLGPMVDPYLRDQVDHTWVRERMVRYVTEKLPWLHPVPALEEGCVKTNTPDGHLILDHHPKCKNIVIAAGFSGHGFKLAPVVGQVVGDLVLGKPPKFDMSYFKISRFGKNPGSTSKL